MQKTLVYFVIILVLSCLNGCVKSTDGGSKLIHFPGVYRIDIQQGNIITQSMVKKIRIGMTRNQILYIMGTPVLEDKFSHNRWTFLYTLKSGNKPSQQKQVTLFFNDNILSKFEEKNIKADKT